MCFIYSLHNASTFCIFSWWYNNIGPAHPSILKITLFFFIPDIVNSVDLTLPISRQLYTESHHIVSLVQMNILDRVVMQSIGLQNTPGITHRLQHLLSSWSSLPFASWSLVTERNVVTSKSTSDSAYCL